MVKIYPTGKWECGILYYYDRDDQKIELRREVRL